MSSGRSFTTTFKTKAETEGISKMQQHLKDLQKSLVENKQEQKALSKEITAAEKEIQRINKQIEKTGGATEKQEKDLERLNKVVKEGKDALEALKLKQSQLQSEINDTNKKIEEERAALEKLKQSMSDAKGHAADLVKEMGAIGAAATAAVAGIFAFTKGSAEWADELNTLSKQTGISTDELQKFAYASDIIDVSVDTMTGSLTKLTRNMQSAAEGGTSAAAEAFTKLGISITDAAGQLRDRQEVFYEVIEALGQIENVTERDALSMNIFGRSAQELNPLILGGADTLKQLGNEAERAGLILDQTTLDGLNEFNNKIDLLKAKGTQIKNLAAAEMTPALDGLIEVGDELLNEIKEMAQSGELKKMAKELGGMIKSGAEALKNIISFVWKYKEAIGAAVAGMVAFKVSMSITGLINSLVQGFKAMKAATESATTAMQALNVKMNANPIGVVISLVAALATGLGVLASSFGSTTSGIKNFNEELDDLLRKQKESEAQAKAEGTEIELLKAEYDKLRSETNLTSSEKERLSKVCEELAGKLGMTTDELRTQEGAYRDLTKEVDDYLSKLEQQAKYDYYKVIIQESTKEVELIKNKISKVKEAQEILREVMNGNTANLDRYDELANELSEDFQLMAQNQVAAVSEAVIQVGQFDNILDELSQQLNKAERAGQEAKESYFGLSGAVDEATVGIMGNSNVLDILTPKLRDAAVMTEELAKKTEACEKKLSELAKTENDLKSKSSSLRSEMSSLTSAMQQLEKGESLSLDKLLDLVEKYPEYAELLLDARDNTDLQKQALEELWTAKKNDYILTQQAALDNIEASNEVALTEMNNISKRISAYYELQKAAVGFGVVAAAALLPLDLQRFDELTAGVLENVEKEEGIRARMAAAEKLQPGDFYTTEKTTEKTGSGSGGSGGGETKKRNTASVTEKYHGESYTATYEYEDGENTTVKKADARAKAMLGALDRAKQLGKATLKEEKEQLEKILDIEKLSYDQRYEIRKRLYDAENKLAEEQEKEREEQEKKKEEEKKKKEEEKKKSGTYSNEWKDEKYTSSFDYTEGVDYAVKYADAKAEAMLGTLDKAKQLGKVTTKEEVDRLNEILKIESLSYDQRYELRKRLYDAEKQLDEERAREEEEIERINAEGLAEFQNLALAAYKKLIDGQIDELEKKNKAIDEAAQKEIDALDAVMKKRNEDKEDQKRKDELDIINAKLKYDRLSQFERRELERRKQDILNEQEDVRLEREYEAEKTEIRSKADADISANQAAIEGLNTNYTQFSDRMALLQGNQSYDQRVANNSTTQNVTIVQNGMNGDQVLAKLLKELGVK